MITLMDWGIKFGQPPANIIMDVSFFKNPWRDEKIRSKEILPNERKKLIMEFMINQDGVHEFCERVRDLVIQYNKLFPDENIVIALFCSAGEYRSPAMVELVGKMLPTGFPFIIKHSDNSKI